MDKHKAASEIAATYTLQYALDRSKHPSRETVGALDHDLGDPRRTPVAGGGWRSRGTEMKAISKRTSLFSSASKEEKAFAETLLAQETAVKTVDRG